MKPFFAFFLVVVVAFVGYHLTFRRLGTRIPGYRFTLTGLEFIGIGLLLGPRFFNMLDDRTILFLAPMIALILGWIGLLFGFQFELNVLRRFAPSFFTAAIIESGITIVFVFIGLYAFLPAVTAIPSDLLFISAAVLACAAACTAPAGLALSDGEMPAGRTKQMRLLRYIASVDGFVPMVVLGFLFFFYPSVSPPAGPWRGEVLVLIISAAILMLYLLFVAQRRGTDELALVIIGMTVLTSGAATMHGFSPLVANFIVGMMLVNLTREKEKIFNLLVSIEKPVYLLMLIFLGAAWQVEGGIMLLAAVFFFLLRIGAKWIGGFAAVRMLPLLRSYPSGIGLGLLEQGGLTLAILLDFHRRFGGTFVDYAIGFVLIAIILNNFVSPYLITRISESADHAGIAQ